MAKQTQLWWGEERGREHNGDGVICRTNVNDNAGRGLGNKGLLKEIG